MRKLFLLSIISVFIFSCQKPEVQDSQLIICPVPDYSAHAKDKQYDSLIEEYHLMGLPGISVLVRDQHGKWVGDVGFASLEDNIPMTACTPSKVASLTKMFVGATTMKLIEEARSSNSDFSLDDPIVKYVDLEIMRRINITGGNTVRNLMNHTTGIYDLITDDKFYLAVLNSPTKRWTQEELLEFVYDKEGYPLNDPYPAEYSNTNTLLLSMVLEEVTGRPHFDLMKEAILTPLNLDDTYYQSREDLPNNVAQGYFDLHNNGTITNVSNIVTGSGNGYGGIYSTVYNLEKFMNALLVNKTLVADSTLAEMQDFQQENEDYFTGLGLVRKFTSLSEAGIGHTGRDLGYVADAFYFPQSDKMMIFLVNYGTNGDSFLKPVFEEFEMELAKLVLQ